VPSQILDLERETRKPLHDSAIERVAVFVRDLALERRRIVVAEIGEHLGARLDDVHVVAEELLGALPIGAVVRGLGIVRLCDQVGVVLLEQVELPADDVGKAAAEDQSSSW
jgi:hypothetical protein